MFIKTELPVVTSIICDSDRATGYANTELSIYRIMTRGGIIKMTSFTDDMMLYLTKPAMILKRLFEILQKYERGSGMAINDSNKKLSVLATNMSNTERGNQETI